MRVLVVSHMYPNPANPAAGIFVHDQIRELAELGCEVRVVSPVPYSPPVLGRLRSRWQALRAVPRASMVEGIPVCYPRFFSLPRMLLVSYSGYFVHRGIRRTVEQIQREFDFDLIHAHTILPDGYAAMLLNRGLRKPLVMTVHGYDAYRRLKDSTRTRARVLEAFRHADRVVCVSNQIREICLQHYPHPALFQVVHNGFRIHQQLGHAAATLRPSGRVLLTVGRIIPQKDHRLVLEALAILRDEMPDLSYRIVGNGYFRHELELVARRLGVRERVEFLGSLPPAQAYAQYASCDVFVMPSWEESFGLVYLEAMSHGKPVIACREVGIAELVEDGKTALLVPPHNSAAVAEAIRRLLEDRELARRIGQAGRELSARYTWRRHAERLLELYREVVGRASRG